MVLSSQSACSGLPFGDADQYDQNVVGVITPTPEGVVQRWYSVLVWLMMIRYKVAQRPSRISK